MFPSRYFGVQESNVVAVFWNDHDHRSPGSRILYKVYRLEQGLAALEKIQRVSTYVSEKTDKEFSGSLMLVAHWIDVPQYPFGSRYFQVCLNLSSY